MNAFEFAEHSARRQSQRRAEADEDTAAGEQRPLPDQSPLDRVGGERW